MDATKTTFKAGFEKLNKDIERFPHVFPITEDMNVTYEGVSRLVMLDRYSYKDSTKETLSEGDIVILTVKEDPKYPARGTGTVLSVNHKEQTVRIKVSEEYQHNIDDFEVEEGGIVTRRILTLDKPLELFYEQIAMRNAHGLAEVEITPELRHEAFLKFYEEQKALNFIPAGRVLYGAGSGTDVTYFNCYVMPFVPDSRGGISDHRKKVMEIMSRGGGVGSNGSTLRPRHTIVKGVNGRSSGSVSWMDDIAKLTHLVEQGGSRRGAQMIMLADWHPDIFEFIISKMQNPRILRYIIENFEDEQIRMLAKEKLHFTPFSSKDINMYTGIVNYKHIPGHGGFDASVIHEAEKKLRDGGTYTVNNPEFLTGANISVCITDDFMDAVMRNEEYALRFPDVEHYDADAMAHYDAEWTNCGDVREWEATGNAVRTYRTVKARELWRLINVCATYAAEPGIFFIDNANKMTNAVAYGQKSCRHQSLRGAAIGSLFRLQLGRSQLGRNGQQGPADGRLRQIGTDRPHRHPYAGQRHRLHPLLPGGEQKTSARRTPDWLGDHGLGGYADLLRRPLRFTGKPAADRSSLRNDRSGGLRGKHRVGEDARQFSRSWSDKPEKRRRSCASVSSTLAT